MKKLKTSKTTKPWTHERVRECVKTAKAVKQGSVFNLMSLRLKNWIIYN